MRLNIYIDVERASNKWKCAEQKIANMWNGKNLISVLLFFLSMRFTMAHRINLILFDFLCVAHSPSLFLSFRSFRYASEMKSTNFHCIGISKKLKSSFNCCKLLSNYLKCTNVYNTVILIHSGTDKMLSLCNTVQNWCKTVLVALQIPSWDTLLDLRLWKI